jgi:NitT/TauT family transport system substrate-binding protein
MKRRIGFLLAVLGATLWLLVPGAQAADKVRFCAAWIIYGQDTGIVTGIERGTFKAEGLDVTFVRGFGSGDTFKRTGTGECDIGNAGAGPSALGRAKGIKAKLFLMRTAKFMETLFYFAESGIKTPKDLEGRRITGGPKASSDILMWPVFAKANGIDTSKVQVLYMAAGVKPASLGAGRVDGTIDFHSNKSRYQKVANQAGKTLVTQLWADHGLDLYTNGLISSDENLAKRKDLTRRFTRAFLKSHAWAFRNREKATDEFVKKYPAQSWKGSLEALNIHLLHFFDDNTDKNGFGHMDPKKMQRTIRVTLGASGIKANIRAEDISTNEFVEMMPDDLRFFFKR